MLEIPETNGFYVYLIRCVDDSLYCGWTINLKKRYETHKKGKGAKYTKAHPPVELCYWEDLLDETSAKKREYEIKRLNRKQKLELLSLEKK